jgi:hypothetical protein
MHEDRLASRVLSDLTIALGRAYPEAGSAPFGWLEPVFGEDIRKPLVERLVAGCQALPAADRALLDAALINAMQRAATTWVGAAVALALLDWIHELAPGAVSARDYASLLFHRGERDAAERAYWLRELVRRFSAWKVNTTEIWRAASNRRREEWLEILGQVDDSGRLDVALWLVKVTREDALLASALQRAAMPQLVALYESLPPKEMNFREEIEQRFASASGLKAGADEHEELLIRQSLENFADVDPCWPIDADIDAALP